MTEDQKSAFKQMMNILMESVHKPRPSNDMLRLWWSKLERYEMQDVCKAFDTWIDTKTHAPTLADIIDLCRHKVTILPRLSSPLNIESNRKHAAEVKAQLNSFVREESNRTGFGWAEKIFKRHESGEILPNISLAYAEKVLGRSRPVRRAM